MDIFTQAGDSYGSPAAAPAGDSYGSPAAEPLAAADTYGAPASQPCELQVGSTLRNFCSTVAYFFEKKPS